MAYTDGSLSPYQVNFGDLLVSLLNYKDETSDGATYKNTRSAFLYIFSKSCPRAAVCKFYAKIYPSSSSESILAYYKSKIVGLISIRFPAEINFFSENG